MANKKSLKKTAKKYSVKEKISFYNGFLAGKKKSSKSK